MVFTIGNAFKYLFRCGEKGNPKQDLEKARWYIQRELDNRLKLPGWRRLFAEDPSFDPKLDCPDTWSEVLRADYRYSGHMSFALGCLMKATYLYRSVNGLKRALNSVETMLKIQTWKENQS